VATRLLNGESLEVTIGQEKEIVHVACLDTPESNQSIPALGWFGRAALNAIEIELERGGLTVCLGEQTPPQRDGDGHRIVAVQLADGRDLATTVIQDGFAVLRPNGCRAGAHYRAAEDVAMREQRGLWGRSGAQPALQAVQIGAAAASPARPRASGGCRLR
jgi:endonuclease YncB( thermonuclease family)